MYVLPDVDVIDDLRKIKPPKQCDKCTLVMATDLNHPGFTRLRLEETISVLYLKHSSLIPGELQLEVEYSAINKPSVVMSHCLKFLCYHHFGNICNRQHALRDLYLAVKEHCDKGSTRSSDSLKILRLCMELSGDKNTAFERFQNALQSNYKICPSAEIGKSNILDR
ncbi:unnamed protein product [Mytilus coruscus]|uniref:Uncharacterized protein n=1 Tax=Mytilus coruscus TaxID=42192 RepID=A0A6J8CPV5_MYTCO|nr:unnamed protein product [Mytilus coruscus]